MRNDFDRYREAKKRAGGRTDRGATVTGRILVLVLLNLVLLAWALAVPGYVRYARHRDAAPGATLPHSPDRSSPPEPVRRPGLLLRERKPREIAVVFLDVGQGDAVLIYTPTQRTLLIDTGSGPQPLNPHRKGLDVFHRLLLPFLRRNAITHLDYLLGTHPQQDHIGGAYQIVRRLPVEEVWLAGAQHHIPARDRLLQMIEHTSARLRVPAAVGGDLQAGDRIELGPGTQAWLLRTDPSNPTVNNTSLPVLLRYGTTSFLFTGDMEKPAERDLLRTWGHQLDADVLKVGHHGSKTSSDRAFLEVVQPRFAVISVGERNRFDHPDPRVLKRLKATGARIYRTDRHGTVMMFSNGRKLRILVDRDLGAVP